MKEYSLYEASVLTGIPKSHLQNAVASGVLEATPKSLKGYVKGLYFIKEVALKAFKELYQEDRMVAFPGPIYGARKKHRSSEEEKRISKARHALELREEDRWLKRQVEEWW